MTERAVLILPPEVFESVVNALAETLILDYRERWNRRGTEQTTKPNSSAVAASPTWLKIADAAKRTQCSEGTIRREVRAGRLRAVRVGGRKSVRFRSEWIDEWLQAASTPE